MKLPALLLLLLSASAQAQTDEALRCRALADDRERLACFDRWAATLARSNTAPAVAAPPAASSFGLPTKNAVEGLDDRIDGLFEGWGPKELIRLQSGQVWQVIDDSSAFVNLKSPKVRVQRNVMGGYVMEFEGSKRTARVKRIQ